MIKQTTHPYHHIYLSPHYDDASLSCGGAIDQQLKAGQSVLVVTICAAEPPLDRPLSPFAEKLHRSWGDAEQMVATRQAEDQAAMERLGCDYHRFDLFDCIYRGDLSGGRWYYTSVENLFDEVDPADHTLANKIAQKIVSLVKPDNRTLLYAPLTVGHHVDHQLTHLAALQLRQQGWRVLFYEDYPYADPSYPFTRPPHALEEAHTLEKTLMAKLELKLQPELRLLSDENLQQKIDSILAYASQLDMLFGGEEATVKAVQGYAAHVGDGQLAERIWVPA